MRIIYISLCLSINFILSGQGAGLTLNKLNKENVEPFHLSISRPAVQPTYPIQKPSSSVLYSFNNPFRIKDELGFFCKVELKWDKILYRPLRFRLGSYDYVNRLEGK